MHALGIFAFLPWICCLVPFLLQPAAAQTVDTRDCNDRLRSLESSLAAQQAARSKTVAEIRAAIQAKDAELQKLTALLSSGADAVPPEIGFDFPQCQKALSASSAMKTSVSRLVQRLEDTARLASLAGRSDLTVSLARARAEAGDLQAMLGFVDHGAGKAENSSPGHVVLELAKELGLSLWTSMRFLGFLIEAYLTPMTGPYAKPLSFGVLVFVLTAASATVWLVLNRPFAVVADEVGKLFAGKAVETPSPPAAMLERKLDGKVVSEPAPSTPERQTKRPTSPVPTRPAIDPPPALASRAKSVDSADPQHFFIGADEDSERDAARQHRLSSLRHAASEDLDVNKKSVVIGETETMTVSISTPLARRGYSASPSKPSEQAETRKCFAREPETDTHGSQARASASGIARSSRHRSHHSSLDDKVLHLEVKGILMKLDRLEGSLSDMRGSVDSVAGLAKVLPRALAELKSPTSRRARSS
mmetsp:Transcript_47105/g.86396  ORF Transcript_47105/g.86396 Transcript_47105/m.86396 type:complete len:476 (-) Transcript_47105:107-1534(-)